MFNNAGTLVRVRGHALVQMDVGANDDTKAVGLGLMIADDQQFTAGATAFPSPIDDLDDDWLRHSIAVLPQIKEPGFAWPL